jgi:hypothetical protein
MEKFLALQCDPKSKVRPIQVLLSSLTDSSNTAFFELADRLSQSDSLNPTYSLVSIRTLIRISLLDNGCRTETLIRPVNSYRWFDLIHALASRSFSPEP